jgi:hypothetical protein
MTSTSTFWVTPEPRHSRRCLRLRTRLIHSPRTASRTTHNGDEHCRCICGARNPIHCLLAAPKMEHAAQVYAADEAAVQSLSTPVSSPDNASSSTTSILQVRPPRSAGSTSVGTSAVRSGETALVPLFYEARFLHQTRAALQIVQHSTYYHLVSTPAYAQLPFWRIPNVRHLPRFNPLTTRTRSATRRHSSNSRLDLGILHPSAYVFVITACYSMSWIACTQHSRRHARPRPSRVASQPAAGPRNRAHNMSTLRLRRAIVAVFPTSDACSLAVGGARRLWGQ